MLLDKTIDFTLGLYGNLEKLSHHSVQVDITCCNEFMKKLH
jgi:uncharacterized protein YkvS